MAVTSQLTTFLDLYTDLQNRVRDQTGVTATQNIAKRYINIALHDMHLGFSEKMPWAERRAVLRTQADYSTGTVSINKGSTALTGSSTLWNTNNDFGVANVRTSGKFVIVGSEEVYSISAVGSDTSVTLNEPFIDADLTGGTYVYFEDEYDLASDFLRPLSATSFSDDLEIELIGRSEFRRRYPRNKVPGKPRVATLLDLGFSGNTTPVRRVRFYQPADAEYLIPYNFITANLAVNASGVGATSLSGDTDEPIVPLGYRHAIVFHALYHWYRDRQDDVRSAEAKGEYTDIILRISGAQEIGANRPRLTPRVGPYKRRAERPYNRGTGRYTTGSRFDELRD